MHLADVSLIVPLACIILAVSCYEMGFGVFMVGGDVSVAFINR